MSLEAVNMAKMLNVAQKVLVHDPERCSGCMLCMVICSFEHYRTFSFERSLIRIVENPKQRGKFVVIHCAHCEYPICEVVCPSNAILKEEETGIVRINPMKCIGCKNCIVMCPISALRFDHKHRVPVKCDLCNGDPRCIKFCSTHALTFVYREEARKRYGVLNEDGRASYV